MKIINILPKSFKQLSLEDQRSWAKIMIAGPILILLNIFWIVRVNHAHGFQQANFLYLLCLLANFFAGYFFIKKKFTFTAHLILIPACIMGSVFIYFTGGVNAPGIFWLTSIPIFFDMFYQKKGGTYGTIITGLVFGIYLFLEYKIGPHTVLKSPEEYKKIKLINCFMFFILTSAYYINYTFNKNKAAEQLNADDKRINNLLRVLVHDLSSPLTIIKTRIGLYVLNPSKTIHLDKVAMAAENAIEQVESIRSMKSIEDGKVRVIIRPINVLDAIKKVKENYSLQLLEKNISVDIEFYIGKDIEIFCDHKILINQILGNILSNAIKFSYQNSVIKFIVQNRGDNKITISIQDFGIGIPHNIGRDLYELDAQTSRVGTNGEMGTGYGMPIMKSFISDFGAKVSFVSQENIEAYKDGSIVGTTFSVVFEKV